MDDLTGGPGQSGKFKSDVHDFFLLSYTPMTSHHPDSDPGEEFALSIQVAIVFKCPVIFAAVTLLQHTCKHYKWQKAATPALSTNESLCIKQNVCVS